jgi:uncharacterized repeat protein (TIGR03803 family)
MRDENSGVFRSNYLCPLAKKERLVRRFIPRIVVSISIVAATIVFTQSAQAQKFTVLHSFTGGQDGSQPMAGVTMDKAGNLYGTAQVGGAGYGTVFKLKQYGSGWIFTPFFTFGGNDGAYPYARVVIGPNGSLYGTTYQGGGMGWGAVFNLRPPPHASPNVLGSWLETVLYSFAEDGDGGNPGFGDLAFDQAGNLYGTTIIGGGGTVFQLSPSNGTWSYTVLFAFSGPGNAPWSTLAWDQAGNLYGTTASGGLYSRGTISKLMPSNGGWVETDLYEFTGTDDGAFPLGSVTLDSSGNIYGTTRTGGDLNDCYPDGCGVVWEITP